MSRFFMSQVKHFDFDLKEFPASFLYNISTKELWSGKIKYVCEKLNYL